MIYHVKPREEKTQVSLMQILMGIEQKRNDIPNTTTVRKVDETYIDDADERFDLQEFINTLKIFNESANTLRAAKRWDLYEHFKLPKKSGGWRPIDAPKPQLGAALTTLRTLIEGAIGDYFHHPCAFAYVRKRCTTDLVKVHQKMESRWFAHFDFSNFFGSTTLDFVLRMAEMVYPLNLVMKDEEGRAEFSKAMELCFLNGGLPQGTQMSPFITNIMMIPLDHELLKFCQNYKPHLIYTRYADDIIISGKYGFDYREVEKRINEILSNFGAPFKIKPEKTHYGSRAGRNWILGVMLNKDNRITIGHDKKKYFKAMLTGFVMSCKNNTPWDIEDIYEFQGKIAYYRMVEKDYVDHILTTYSQKFGVNIEKLIKDSLKGYKVA